MKCFLKYLVNEKVLKINRDEHILYKKLLNILETLGKS